MLLGWKNGWSGNEAVELPVDVLRKHAFVGGSSGSGKTVMCKILVEEAVRAGIPVIAIDPQGDLASLGRVGNIDEIIEHKVPMDVFTGFYDKVDMKIWTPGSTYGIPISVSPLTQGALAIGRMEDRVRAYSSVATALAEMVGVASDEAVAAFSLGIEWCDTNGHSLRSLGDFADLLANPPQALADRMSAVFGEGARRRAEKKIRAKLLGPSRLMFEMGQPIDVAKLLGVEPGGAKEQGKTRVSVIYLNTLGTDEEKHFFLSALTHAIYGYIMAHPSVPVQGLLYIDEAAAYLPPLNMKQPACKEGLMLLLRQARKYGFGCIIATQSPGDLDYKGLGQIGTWLLGRLTTEQEAWKVQPAINAIPGIDANAILEALPGTPIGQFVGISPDAGWGGAVKFQQRYLVTEHVTLSDPATVEVMIPDEDRTLFG